MTYNILHNNVYRCQKRPCLHRSFYSFHLRNFKIFLAKMLHTSWQKCFLPNVLIGILNFAKVIHITVVCYMFPFTVTFMLSVLCLIVNAEECTTHCAAVINTKKWLHNRHPRQEKEHCWSTDPPLSPLQITTHRPFSLHVCLFLESYTIHYFMSDFFCSTLWDSSLLLNEWYFIYFYFGNSISFHEHTTVYAFTAEDLGVIIKKYYGLLLGTKLD